MNSHSDLGFSESTFKGRKRVKTRVVEPTLDTPFKLARFWHEGMCNAGAEPPCEAAGMYQMASEVLSLWGPRLAKAKVEELIARVHQTKKWVSLKPLLKGK